MVTMAECWNALDESTRALSAQQVRTLADRAASCYSSLLPGAPLDVLRLA